MKNFNNSDQFGINGMFESGVTNPDNNTLSGMGSGYETIGYEPKAQSPQELSGIMDGLADLWDKGTETITSGLDTMFTANVDSYVEEHTPLTPSQQASQDAAAAAAAGDDVYIPVPQESGAAKLLKNPLVWGAGALILFKVAG